MIWLPARPISSARLADSMAEVISASYMTLRASQGWLRRAFSSISEASSSWSRLPQLTPMRTGLLPADGRFDHLAELPVALVALADVAGVDAVLGQRLRAVGKLGEQAVAVVVEVAHQRHVDAHAVELLADVGHLPAPPRAC